MDIDNTTPEPLSQPLLGEGDLLERAMQEAHSPEPAAAAAGDLLSPSLLDERFAVLEARLGELLRLYEQMAKENQQLRIRHAELLAECEQLQQSREQAQARLDAMVLRLRTLEPSS